MLKTLVQLLGNDAALLRRYGWMTVGYGLLCGLTMATLLPVLGHLLAADIGAAGAWLMALAAGVLGCWYCRRQVEQAGVRVGVAVLQGGRHRLGEHVAGLPSGWFTPANKARTSHLITQGMMAVAQLPAHVFTPVITGIVTALVMAMALLALHGALGLIALAALPVLAAVCLLSAGLSRQAGVAYHRYFADTSQRMVEFAQAQSVLRAFNGEGKATRQLEQAVEQQRRAGKRLVGRSALASVLNGWAVQLVFAVLLVTTTAWLSGNLEGAQATEDMIGAVMALLIISRVIEPLLDVAGYGEILANAKGLLAEIDDIFSTRPLPQPEHGRLPADTSIELRGVHFCYEQDAPAVLHDVNLHIAAGSMVAVIGASGSGKTTLLRLMARFFDVSQGSLMLGGVDVRDMTDAQRAELLGQIFQESELFSGSISDNIRLGKDGATDEEVMQAARDAGVDEIIQRLPQGLNTQTGEGGARLSGGERQRIAIARALLKGAPVMLLDEATAALDAENQAVIAGTLKRLQGRCTLVVVAHQLSTVAMADQIVVLEHGQVIEQGAPAALRARKGRYAQFLARQQAATGWRISSGQYANTSEE